MRLTLQIATLTLLSCISILSALAQVNTSKGQLDSAVSELKRNYPNAHVILSDKTGLPESIVGLQSNQAAQAAQTAHVSTLQDADAIVSSFFTSNGGLFLQPQGQSEIRVTSKRLDPQLGNRAVVRVQQVKQGVEVFGAEAIVDVNLTAAAVEQMTTSFVVPPTVSVTPSITQDNAQSVARTAYQSELAKDARLKQSEEAVTKHGQQDAVQSSLVIFDPTLLSQPATGQKLTWLVSVGTFKYFIDAQTGQVLHRFRNLHDVKQIETYDSLGALAIPGIRVLTSDGPVAGQVPSNDAIAAQNGASSTYDFYLNRFGRASYDNSASGGSILKSTVRYGQLQNAYWDLNLQQMVYGPGWSLSLSVVGHEITHGVISHECKLVYDGEPGAANEALADLFGAMINSAAGPEDWKIGEQVPGFSPSHPMRNMSDPHNGGFAPGSDFGGNNIGQPDSKTEQVSPADKICDSTSDTYNGCVHFNSGILNKAFYLAAKGGTQNNVAVSGIGLEKLQQIVYRALVNKLTMTSQFRDVAVGTIASCSELASQSFQQINSNDCVQVQAAFHAVGILQ